MESSAITTKCVRCESEENIENYLHTTPDLASFRRISRHVTRYTTYKGTGGTGYVPVCSRCIKKFSNWKIYNNINLGLTGVIWLFFSLMLVLLMIAGPTSYIPGLKDIPFEIIITGFGVSLTLVIISVIISFYLNIVSKSNPKNIINIRRRTIRVSRQTSPGCHTGRTHDRTARVPRNQWTGCRDQTRGNQRPWQYPA